MTRSGAQRSGEGPAVSDKRSPRKPPAAEPNGRRLRRLWWGRALPYLYILPCLGLLLVFDIWPIVLGFWISLWRWGVIPENFIGLANYERLLSETVSFEDGPQLGEMGQSLAVTFYYVLGTVPVTLALSFVVANLLYQRVRGLGFFRTAFFLPYVTSTVAAAMVFLWIFNPQVGLANEVLKVFGLPAQEWLQDPDPVLKKLLGGIGVNVLEPVPDFFAGPSMALLCVIVFSVWSALGFNVVIMLAGLSNVPTQLYDAGRLDGAGPLQLLRHVTLPMLSPTLFFLTITSTITAFQSFEAVYTLTGGGSFGGGPGGPLNTTMTITLYIFQNFYERPSSVGYAAAVSFVLFLILLLLTLIQFKVLGRRVHYE